MKKFLSLITLLLLVVSVNNAYAGKPKQLTSTITWELKKDGTLVIEGTGEMPDFKDREMYPWFKKAEKITAVRIGEGITTVGQRSFENLPPYVSKKGRCYNISKVTLPSSLKAIGWAAFRNNKITSLIIPDSVTSIGGIAFQYCSSLKSITIPNSVTSIGNSAFEKCYGLQSVTIPDSVTDIGKFAFNGCQGLKKVYISDILAWCMISFGYAANPLHHGASLYLNNELVTNLTIPDGITKIGAYAFEGCSSLKSITIPDSVTVIAEEAFANCNISKLVLPNSVKTIEKLAFYNSLNRYSTLSINNSVQSIGKDAFANKDGAFYGTVINLPSWLNVEKSFVVGISKESYRAYRPSAKGMYDKGHKYFGSKNYKTALEYFLKGTQCENDSGFSSDVAKCYLYAGWCYGHLNDYSNAIIMLEKAEELGDKNARSALKSYREIFANQTIIAKANAEYSKGNYELAFQYYEQAYKENKTDDNLKNINKVPEYYKNKHDYNNALKYYKRIYSIRSADDVKSNLVLCYEKLGNINGAIDVYKPQAEKGNKECQYKIAQLYEKTKNKNLAIFWYKKAAEQKHLRAEEALAKYGIYINTQNSNSNSNSNNNDHNHQQQQQVYTPEYGVRDVWVNCFDCHGTGKCSYCNGTGWCISTNGHGEYNSTYKCTICHGSGRCTYCYGSGGHYEKQQYQIR